MSEINNNLNNENENNNTDRSIVTISLNSQRQINFNENNNNIKGPKAFDNYFTRNSESFTDKTFNGNANFSQNSILKIVQILNTNNQIKDSSPFLNNEIHNSNNNENLQEKCVYTQKFIIQKPQDISDVLRLFVSHTVH